MTTWWKLHGPRKVWLAMLGVSLIIAVDALLGMDRGRTVAERAEAVASRLSRAHASSATADSNTTSNAASSPGLLASERVRSRYLFMPPPPEAFRQVQGVLGDRVLYPGGQSFAVGEDAMGAKVLAVGPDWVELEHRGEKVRVDVFSGGGGMPRFQGRMNPSHDLGEMDREDSQREHSSRQNRRRPSRFKLSPNPNVGNSQQTGPSVNPDSPADSSALTPDQAGDPQSE